MRKIVMVSLIISVLSSCDPDVPGEGINLPAMEFGLTVSPDTAYIKLGDTVTLNGSISSTLSDGTKIEDGEAKIALYYGYTNQIPIKDFQFAPPRIGNDLIYIEYKGNVEIVKNDGMINRINAIPYGDSIQLEIAFVPQKKGTYCFQVQSMFYEGSKGKTRTQPKFDMLNHHFDELWKIPGDNYQPGDIGYDSRYNFAVTD